MSRLFLPAVLGLALGCGCGRIGYLAETTSDGQQGAIVVDVDELAQGADFGFSVDLGEESLFGHAVAVSTATTAASSTPFVTMAALGGARQLELRQRALNLTLGRSCPYSRIGFAWALTSLAPPAGLF